MESFGRYKLHEVLGKGAFGTVYRATDLHLNRDVALKVLHPELAQDPHFIDSFRREARMMAQVQHASIVTIYELNEIGGRFFIAMKYLLGGDLAKRLKKEKFSFVQVASIFLQICEGLQVMHDQKLVHCDLKPTNILFDSTGRAAISDLGLAQAYIGGTDLSSYFNKPLGASCYRAPELWKTNQPVGPSADVYSLGCIFVEALTGLAPFHGETPEQVMTRHLVDGPDFGPGWPPFGCPPGLKAFIARTIERNPTKRYLNAAHFADALRALDPTLQFYSPGASLFQDSRSSSQFKNSENRQPQSAPTGSFERPYNSERDLAYLYEDGMSAFFLNDWRRASECFQKIAQIRPNYRDVAQRLNQVRQRVDWQQRYQQAQEKLAGSDWKAALMILEKLQSEAPDDRNIAHLLQSTRLLVWYADATHQSRVGNWRAVIDIFDQIHALHANYPDPDHLLATARVQLAAQERTRKLTELYSSALDRMDEKKWKDAERILLQLKDLEPGYRDVSRLLDKVRTEAATHQAQGEGKKWSIAIMAVVLVTGIISIILGSDDSRL